MRDTYMRRYLLTLSFAVLMTAPAAAQEKQEKLPPGAKLVKLEARPTAVSLKQPFDYAQLLLTGTLETGEQLDVTRMASVEKPANVNLAPSGLVRPIADGKAELK